MKEIMIPSYASHRLIQYSGYLNNINPDLDLDKVSRIKITDNASQGILFNSVVILKDKIDWSSDGYSIENRYLFEKIDNTKDNNSKIFFITDKDSRKIKIMSLDNTYSEKKIEYKTDNRDQNQNQYNINFE
jgi:hypothetical protein